MNVHGSVLAEDNAMGIDEKKATVGLQGTENFGWVAAHHARQHGCIHVRLEDIDQITRPNVETLPVDDGSLRALQHTESVGRTMVEGNFAMNDLGPCGQAGGPRPSGQAEGEYTEGDGQGSSLDGAEAAIP